MFNKPYVRSIALSSIASFVLLLPSAGIAMASNGSRFQYAGAPPESLSIAGGGEMATKGPSCKPAVKYKRENFSHPTNIDNKFLPFVPGTEFILQGTSNAGTGTQPHTVIFTVSDVTKVIDGVRTRVMFDRDISDGALAERELSFFAQDDAGNVWNLGEYPEEIENGKVVDAPFTWMNGMDKAQGGIHMLAKPKVDEDVYLQGWSPSIDFLDCAQVYQKGQTVCVPVDCYKNVLVTQETSPLDPESGAQFKYHAPGVGIVAIGALNDPEAETLVLVSHKHLSEDAMENIDEQVCKQDKRGHKVSDVYKRTGSAEYNGKPCED